MKEFFNTFKNLSIQTQNIRSTQDLFLNKGCKWYIFLYFFDNFSLHCMYMDIRMSIFEI